jgi:hypothetical protein
MISIQGEFEATVATARQALEEFNKEPLVDSKRGGPRLAGPLPRLLPGSVATRPDS